MTETQNGKATNWTKAILLALVVLACGDDTSGSVGNMMRDAGQMLADAMREGGDLLTDASSDAQAQDGGGAVAGMPAGAVIAWAGPVAPDGWALCDGAELSRAQYPELFASIGTVHGSGDGATTFRLPDYRGRFLRGADNGAGRDPSAASRQAANTGGVEGDSVGTVQGYATAMPSNAFSNENAGAHNHQVLGINFETTAAGTMGVMDYDSTSPLKIPTDEAGDHTHAINGGDSETRPVNAAVNFIIKV